MLSCVLNSNSIVRPGHFVPIHFSRLKPEIWVFSANFMILYNWEQQLNFLYFNLVML